jgi:hypothetical protein
MYFELSLAHLRCDAVMEAQTLPKGAYFRIKSLIGIIEDSSATPVPAERSHAFAKNYVILGKYTWLQRF